MAWQNGVDMSMNKTPGFIEITELDTGFWSCWDQDAGVAQVQLTAKTISHGDLVNDNYSCRPVASPESVAEIQAAIFRRNQE